MKHFVSFLLIIFGCGSASVFLASCQKELTFQTAIEKEPLLPSPDCTTLFYSITVYNGVKPSRVIGIENSTGEIINNVQAFCYDTAGNIIPLTNLKGICRNGSGQYFLTTGNPASQTQGTSIYNNALFKLNQETGECSFISTSPEATVSDLEYNPVTQKFYGLVHNSNLLIQISEKNSVFGDYSFPIEITGIANDYTLRGLSLICDVNGKYLVGCASSVTLGEPAKLYSIPLDGGMATFLADIDQLGGWVGGNCGIGFDRHYNRLNINRNASIVTAGLAYIKWEPPFLPNLVSNWTYGAEGFDYEDLTSSIY